MVHGTWRGHTIKWSGEKWVFYDTGEPTVGSKRPCGHCHKHSTAEGHDACLGTLAGVMNACCGHGGSKDAYVHLNDGSVLRGDAAQKFIAEVK